MATTYRREAVAMRAVLGLVLLASVGPSACGSPAPPPAGPGLLDPTGIPKFVEPLVVPPEMPFAAEAAGVREYHIAVRQISQQVLPPGFGATPVFAYGAVGQADTFNYPGFTIEARANTRLRVKWVNGLVDDTGAYRPHLLPVDPTLYWANPLGPRDGHGSGLAAYAGPVPIVTHVHGAHVADHSDGYPQAWFLPAAINLPAGTFRQGSRYAEAPGAVHEDGAAWFEYGNDQPAATLWYHDHALGLTRLNVYAGVAGFYLLRDALEDGLGMPGPSPRLGDPSGTRYYEIPIVIQDRSFYDDGSLFYPDSRAFFDGYAGPYYQGGASVADRPSPIWNPETFGNVMVVNGRSWPYLEVEARRYRLRLLNGSNSRFLILSASPALSFAQVGADQGLLPNAPVAQDSLLLAPAERADVIVDFSGLAPGTAVTLLNQGPDEPFGGGIPGVDFPPADPDTTGQVMQFRVVASTSPDTSTVPSAPVPPGTLATVLPPRDLTLNEVMHEQDGSEYPIEALLGTAADGPLEWDTGTVTETPSLGSTERWRIINLTGDAHPIHLHLVRFQVVERTPFDASAFAALQAAHLADPVAVPPPRVDDTLVPALARGPEPAEAGFKDTAIAYPNEVTEVIAVFDLAGRYVWHCHILEHEDNEMMRPFEVVP